MSLDTAPPPIREEGNPDAQTAPDGSASAPDRIVFYDGNCGLCDSAVQTLLKWDREGVLSFAPLQGETAAEMLPAEFREHLDTLVFRLRGSNYVRSSAIVRILWQLGFGAKTLAALMWIVPKPVRNLGYRGISKIRYRVFGEADHCRMPTEAERERMLP